MEIFVRLIFLALFNIIFLGNVDFDIDFVFEGETLANLNAEYGCGVTFKDRFLYLGGAGHATRQVLFFFMILLLR